MLDTPLTYAQVVRTIRCALFDADIAAVTGVSTRAVQNWAAGVSKPQGEHRARLLQLQYVVEQLMDVYTAEGADIWLHAYQRPLRGWCPVELLAQGRFNDVTASIERLAGGPADDHA